MSCTFPVGMNIEEMPSASDSGFMAGQQEGSRTKFNISLPIALLGFSMEGTVLSLAKPE